MKALDVFASCIKPGTYEVPFPKNICNFKTCSCAYQFLTSIAFFTASESVAPTDTNNGFDVFTTNKRSRRWLALDEIDYRRIGKRSFWQTHVLPRLNCYQEKIVNDSQISKTDSGKDEWLRSDEARKVLQVSTCDLAHLRQGGKIAFRKAGNAYLHSAADCEQLARRTDEDKTR